MCVCELQLYFACVCVWPSVIFLRTPSKQEADSLHKLWQWPTCCRDSFALEMDPSNSMPRSKRTDATLSTMADQMKNVILSSQQQVWKNERQPLALCLFFVCLVLFWLQSMNQKRCSTLGRWSRRRQDGMKMRSTWADEKANGLQRRYLSPPPLGGQKEKQRRGKTG